MLRPFLRRAAAATAGPTRHCRPLHVTAAAPNYDPERRIGPDDPLSSSNEGFLNFQEKLDKAIAQRSAHEEKAGTKGRPLLDTDGPPAMGKLGHEALKGFRPAIGTSALQGVVFDLSSLLNVLPTDNGDAALKSEVVSNSVWNIGEGAREAIIYLEGRGIQTAVLPRLHLDENSELVQYTVDQFQERLDHRFRLVAQNVPLRDVGSSLAAAVKGMRLASKHVMVVSYSPMVLQQAKDSRMLTCAVSMGGKNWKAKSIAAYSIAAGEGMTKLKDCVEEMNGISFR